MDNFNHIVFDKNVPTYDYEEYLNALHTELDEERRRREARAFDKGKKQGFELGEKNGIKQGIKHERKNIIDKLLKFGMSQEDIDKALKM